MRIKSLKLTNFQKHGSLVVEFSPYITTIQGRTDAGKSSIMRALRWVLLNDFSGEDFIKAGKREASAEVTMFFGSGQDELVLTRTKGRLGSKNEYNLEGSVFKSFGQGVPQEIAKVTQTNDINFQGQFDAPFWFALSGGEVSKRLNAVIDLSVIDQTLANIGVAVRRATSAEEVCVQRLAAAQEKLAGMIDAEQRVADYKSLRQNGKATDQKVNACEQLAVIMENVNFYKARSEEFQQKQTDSFRLLSAARALLKVESNREALSEIIDTIAIPRPVEPPDFRPLNQLYIKCRNVAGTMRRLHDLVAQAQERERICEEWAAERSAREDNLKDRTKGICPLCLRPLRASSPICT